jgi:hypothetical protein
MGFLMLAAEGALYRDWADSDRIIDMAEGVRCKLLTEVWKNLMFSS